MLAQGGTQVRNALWESGAGELQHHEMVLTPQLCIVKPRLKSDLSRSISQSHISQDRNFHMNVGTSLKQISCPDSILASHGAHPATLTKLLPWLISLQVCYFSSECVWLQLPATGTS